MRDIAVDTCCLINLLAAGTILPAAPTSQAQAKRSPRQEVPQAFSSMLHVPRIVAAESLYLLQPDDDDDSVLVKPPIDLTAFFDERILVPCDLEGEQEAELFVQIASRLDDGEAACLAIAGSRGWTLATDDRLARSLAVQNGVPIVTTAELVKQWAENVQAKPQKIGKALRNIERLAKFSQPGAGQPGAGQPNADQPGSPREGYHKSQSQETSCCHRPGCYERFTPAPRPSTSRAARVFRNLWLTWA